MFKKWLHTAYDTPGTGGSGGGATDNSAGSVSEGVEPITSGIASGTASDAMIKAALAASSAEEGTEEPQAVTPHGPATTGITTEQAPSKQPATGAAATVGRDAPEPRIVTAVKNARADERDVVTKELEKKYGWAAGVEEGDARIAFGVAHQLSTNAEGFLQNLAKDLGYTVTKAGQAPAAATGTTEEMPKPAYRSEDGQLFYSADQLTKVLDIQASKIEAKLRGELKPLQDAHSTQAATDRERAQIEQNRTLVAETMTELRAYPHFQMDDGKGGKIDNPAIMKELLAIPADVRVRNPIAALYRAYNSFFTKGVFPTIASSAEETVRASNAKKLAAARGGAHPVNGSGDGTTTTEIKGVDGLAAHMARLAGSNDPRFVAQ